MNQKLYQPVILKHNQKPYNCNKLEKYTHFAEGYNKICGDHIELYINAVDDTIVDIGFVVQSCAVTKACASVMTLMVKGKSFSQVKTIIQNFHMMWESDGTIGNEKIDNPDLAVLAHLHEYPSRWKCATLPWETLAAAIAGTKNTVTTE